jgi:hypothetical protein
MVQVNGGRLIGLHPHIFFPFSQTKYQLRKKAGVPPDGSDDRGATGGKTAGGGFLSPRHCR